jgi:hypothetical protein
MPSLTFLERLRPGIKRFYALLGTPERSHSLILLLWPIVALIIGILVVRTASTAKDLADLISAFASLAWPLATVAIVNWFRPEIRAVLVRLRKGKFLGTEFELDELQAKTEVAEAKIPIVSGTLSATLGEVRLEATGTVGPGSAQDEIEEVLREAGRSPRLGLMLLSAKMERAARDRAEEAGLNMRSAPVSLRNLIHSLVQAKQLPEEAGDALNLFNQVRNRIIHGHDAGDDEIARAIDSGTRLLRLLLSRPHPQPETKGPEDGG